MIEMFWASQQKAISYQNSAFLIHQFVDASLLPGTMVSGLVLPFFEEAYCR